MILYPAIDVLDGEVVRLVEGDFQQKTIFPHEPAELLAEFVATGARYVHLVDLSGARNPAARQITLFHKLFSGLSLHAQVGGGIREIGEITALLQGGAERVVLGSVIVSNPDTAFEALAEFGPDRLTFALDIRLSPEQEPIVITHGWTTSSGRSFSEVVAPFAARGLKRVLCTDIAVDGRLAGPNFDLYDTLQRQFPALEIQASGGVSALKDLRALRDIGVHSAIVGRALLSGAFSLKEALAYAE